MFRIKNAKFSPHYFYENKNIKGKLASTKINTDMSHNRFVLGFKVLQSKHKLFGQPGKSYDRPKQ